MSSSFRSSTHLHNSVMVEKRISLGSSGGGVREKELGGGGGGGEGGGGREERDVRWGGKGDEN